MSPKYLKRPTGKNKAIGFGDIENMFTKDGRENNFEKVNSLWENIKVEHQLHHKKRLSSQTKPTLNFLLSFEEDFDLPDKNKVEQMESVKNFIKAKYDYPVYLVQHNDEKALHYSFTIINYDKKTMRPISKQIDTRQLQDDIADWLKKDNQDYGHKRGIQKSISLAEHKSILDGKVAELENEKKILQDEIDEMKIDADKYDKYFTKCENYEGEMKTSINKMLNDYVECSNLYKGKDVAGLGRLFARKLKAGDVEDIDDLIEKVRKTINQPRPTL
jgi:hypothetical protein